MLDIESGEFTHQFTMIQSNEGGDEPLLPDMGPENDQILANSDQDELQVFAGDEYTPQLPRSLAQVPPRTVRPFMFLSTSMVTEYGMIGACCVPCVH